MTDQEHAAPTAAAGEGLQDQYAPRSICFGCGAANPGGLAIKSKRANGGLSTEFQPRPEHQAFKGVVSGGIIGTLIDCHGNWTAAVALMDAGLEERLPATVTASFQVELRRPTPFGPKLLVTSQVTDLDVAAGRVRVDVQVEADGRVTASGQGLFVAVTEGHPAFHRWD